MMETVYITAGFAWKPEAHVDTKHVELLISKAEDIYQDHFDNNDVLIHSVKYSTYNLEQWNADGGSFCVCPSLEPGVYQFVFRVDNGEEKQLKISDYYEQTFLGNGRAVNYIELNMAYGNTNQRKLIRCKCLLPTLFLLLQSKVTPYLIMHTIPSTCKFNIIETLDFTCSVDGL